MGGSRVGRLGWIKGESDAKIKFNSNVACVIHLFFVKAVDFGESKETVNVIGVFTEFSRKKVLQ